MVKLLFSGRSPLPVAIRLLILRSVRASALDYFQQRPSMTMTIRLIYAFDLLCGWCYGFAPALRAVRHAFPDLPIDLRTGGLVTGERVRPFAEMAAYILNASTRLQAVTSVTLGGAFKSNILQNRSVIASSIPPCEVVRQVRERHSDRALDFAEALQIAHIKTGAI